MSLFAFQDIITSVTAIMILLVLILTLEFVARARQVDVAEDHRQVATDLKQTIRAGEARLDALQRTLQETRGAAKSASAATQASVEQRYAEATARQAALEQEVARAETAVTRAADERRSAEDRLLAATTDAAEATRLEAKAESIAATAVAIEEANREERQRQQDLAAAASQPTRLLFNPSDDGGKTAVMVEVAADGVTALPADGGAPQALGWGLTGPSFAFRRWLAGLRSANDYVVIMLRPSGISRYESVRDAIVEAGIDVGTELVPERLAIVVGQEGGGP